MNTDDLRWLLQTIEERKTAERFVVAQYERGRISFEVMTDIACERGWISRTAIPLFTACTPQATERATTPLPMAIA